ncbi:AlpA family phage regulatory protein [Actinoplanes sp. NPDC051861]|uniref:helix-turn-helix transcriptional regulator n=1 Tax=Actinoplanes sp. NPDC051861 TaxID=3155170 RepID=UPI003441A75E
MDRDSIRLVGAHEIRDLLGVSRQRIYQLAARPDFPRPVAELSQGKVWNLTDIEAWLTARVDSGVLDRPTRQPRPTPPESP